MTADPSSFDRANVAWLMEGHGDWFSAKLLRLMAKADPERLDLLRRGFPEHVALYEAWLNSTPAFTCPECHSTSHNPDDVREGYCGSCHAWTGARGARRP